MVTVMKKSVIVPPPRMFRESEHFPEYRNIDRNIGIFPALDKSLGHTRLELFYRYQRSTPYISVSIDIITKVEESPRSSVFIWFW